MDKIFLSNDSIVYGTFYLEKDIYIRDDELFFGKNTTKIITKKHRNEFSNFKRNDHNYPLKYGFSSLNIYISKN